MSKIDMAYEVLGTAGEPLYFGEIAQRIHEEVGVTVSWTSLASALSRCADRGIALERRRQPHLAY